jgi:hypothetical protein
VKWLIAVEQSYPCVNTLGGVSWPSAVVLYGCAELPMCEYTWGSVPGHGEFSWALLLRVKVLCVLKKQVSDSRSVSRAGKKQVSYRRSLLVPLASLVDVSLLPAVCLAGLTSGRPPKKKKKKKKYKNKKIYI